MNWDRQKRHAFFLGDILILSGILGFFTHSTLLGMTVSFWANALHILTGLGAFVVVYVSGGRLVRLYNRLAGALYVLLALAGFLGLPVLVESLKLNTVADSFHLALGAYTVLVAFAGPFPRASQVGGNKAGN